MQKINTINPATEEVLNSYPLLDQNQVAACIEKMALSQQTWADETLATRLNAMQRVAEILRKDLNNYATMIVKEMGKPFAQAQAEIEKCAKLCDYYVDVAPKFLQLKIIPTRYKKSYCVPEPTGIIFAVMPWNYPFWQVMRFAVPNLILGNAGLLKHAPNTIGAGVAIEEMFLHAGFPRNIFKNIIIDVSLAPFVIQHPKITGVTLTGSYVAGTSIAKEAGKVVKKVVLELGGSDPYLILKDADLKLAAEQSVISRLNNCGQVCIAAKRIIVVKDIKDEFIAEVIKKAQTYKIGNPLDPNITMGPMARADLRAKLTKQVEMVIKEGAKCLMGGKPQEGVGFYYPVTILTEIKSDSIIFNEELFGPVICIIEAKDEEEAIKLANNTNYGLSAAVFTKDLERGEHIARSKIKAGACAVNSFVSSDPALPFGGTKQSGYGRELSQEGLYEFANIKTITIQDG